MCCREYLVGAESDGAAQITWHVVLRSRAAVLAAVNDLDPVFVDNAGLMAWLERNEVATLTDTGDWPTAETVEI